VGRQLHGRVAEVTGSPGNERRLPRGLVILILTSAPADDTAMKYITPSRSLEWLTLNYTRVGDVSF
jgi:hypothetical protein